MKKLLSIVITFALTFSLSIAAFADATERFPLDPEVAPDNTMNYVILKGSWYEMGVQYAQQDLRSVIETAVVGTAKAMKTLGTSNPDEMSARLKPYEELLERWFPQILDFCKGIADETGMQYYDVLVGYIASGPNLAEPDENSNQCSMVAAWGEATGNGDLVAAYNSDRPVDASAYQSCVIAIPVDGNAFICARDLMGPTINEQGLVVMSTGGQDELPGDVAFGVPYSLPIVYCAAYCDSADGAKDEIDKVSISGALNVIIADEEKAYVLETTSSHKQWRANGDFGETDYIIANNHFLTDEMQTSLYTDHSYDDCPYRYATVEKFLERDFGFITVDTIREAEASTSFYDYVNDVWVDNTWDPRLAYNAPEALSDSFKTVIHHVANATTRTVYECRGQQETLSSYVPEAIESFSQVTLDRDAEVMVSTAGRVLGKLLLQAGGEIDKAGARNDCLN